MELTKNSEIVFYSFYKIYKKRINEGETIDNAKKFSPNIYHTSFELWNIPKENYNNAVNDLKRKGLIVENILGNIKLTDDAIAICENRKLNFSKEAIDFISKFI